MEFGSLRLSPEDTELLQRALAKLDAANGTIQFLSEYFRDKYGLSPANQIARDGTIVGPLVTDSGVSSANGRVEETNGMRELQSDLALLRETTGDT